MTLKQKIDKQLCDAVCVIVRYVGKLTFVHSDLSEIVREFSKRRIDLHAMFENRLRYSPLNTSLTKLVKAGKIRRTVLGEQRNAFNKPFEMFGGVTMQEVKEASNKIIALHERKQTI